jgi:outer membrane protein OmpA-like peptidoglycan-associated protein
MRYILVISCFIYLSFLANSAMLFSQNLVPNGSFDDLKGSKPTMKPWKKINTVDFFVNAEDRRYKEVNAAKRDRNYILRKPRSGHAYVGVRVWPKYNEFLQIQLRRTLIEGRAYSFEMYVTPSRYSNCYLKKIGASFYPNRPPYTTRQGKEDFPPQVESYRPFGIRDTAEWIRVNGVFVAKGGEKIMTIGNFSSAPQEKFRRKKLSLKKREAYYYIDDITVYELDDKGLPILDSLTFALTLQDTLDTDSVDFIASTFSLLDSTVTNIYFEENSAKLDGQGYRKLGVIIEYLFENPGSTIRVDAYASPGELDGMELKLAEKRAKAVYVFLTGNKIDKHRIELKPIGNSCEFFKANDAKRRFCRKVEIVVIEN